ncbi:large subunit GTPase 1 homolog [Dermacentor silvarum]|uniref:large subunit GTPase 1 homolog n=1 Tax=Dermacentor silvarum TaxID=543639 RepID=UPI00210079BF|nr:large subunit GTPase 1 homolog [Dermacentor silvarum]
MTLYSTKVTKKEMGKVNDALSAGTCTEANSSELYSKDELLQLFRTIHPESKQCNGKTVIGLVGYPNVGKSSTINALVRCKKVSVSTTPGKTKHFQTLNLDDELCLCDCPGLVFPNFVSNKAEMIVHGILPIDQMTDHVPPVNLISFILLCCCLCQLSTPEYFVKFARELGGQEMMYVQLQVEQAFPPLQ